MIDELQTMSSRYDTFRDSLEQALISGIDMYRRQNIKFRTEPAPAYFETAVDASFIKTFEQNYPALSSELMSDQESEQNLTQWAEKIEKNMLRCKISMWSFLNPKNINCLKLLRE